MAWPTRPAPNTAICIVQFFSESGRKILPFSSAIFSVQIKSFILNLSEIYHQFLKGLLQTGWQEALAVVCGIASVWFSRKENILVYPIGLINTILYVILSVQGELYGEAAVNCYYTAMSLYGWYQWKRTDEDRKKILHIEFSDKTWIKKQILFFISCFLIIYLCLFLMKRFFAEGAIPWADGIASAAAFTGMWLMTRKKVESWAWWILTNIFSIPLYFVKGFVFTSVYYLILLLLAIMSWISWSKKAKSIHFKQYSA